jgi:hypothetical protein
MADMELNQVYRTPDGQTFDSKAEAMDHMRRPVITEALNGLIDDNAELVTWLIDNRTQIEDAFEAGTIKRVSKSEKNQLEKALKAISDANEPKFKFVADNAAAILDTFRWPKVTRMDADEKTAVVKTELTTLADGNADVADFVIENKTAILEAYEAGRVKRALNPKAKEGLARYQAEKAAAKAAAQTTEAEPEVEEAAPVKVATPKKK